jgi:hypothetical protein
MEDRNLKIRLFKISHPQGRYPKEISKIVRALRELGV